MIEYKHDILTIPYEYKNTDNDQDNNHSPSYASTSSQSCVLNWTVSLFTVFLFTSGLWIDD